jgi:AcrR family transcriptional regulator
LWGNSRHPVKAVFSLVSTLSGTTREWDAAGKRAMIQRDLRGRDYGMAYDIARNRGEESKEAILAAARQLFAKRGYRGTPLAAIAEAAGLSEPGLLHHYRSKTALLLAVLASRDSEDGRLSSPRLDAPGIGIIDGLAALVAHNESEPELVALFSMLLGEAVAADHPAHEYFEQRYQQIRARFTRHLREAQTAGTLGPGIDPVALANVLIAVLDGMQFQWLLDQSVDMSASYAALAEMIRATGPPDRTAAS